MNVALLRRLAAALLVTLAWVVGAAAQPAQPAAPGSRLKTFSSADAAATAFIDALRGNDEAALGAILGRSWRVFVPPLSEDVDNQRERFLAAWNDKHNVAPQGDDKARLEIGSTGFVFPLPLIRSENGWRFDVATGLKEVMARKIGRNEPCPCGSGRKYKQCHGALQPEELDAFPNVGRNDPCPCGSGQKYKHCHGSLPE